MGVQIQTYKKSNACRSNILCYKFTAEPLIKYDIDLSLYNNDHQKFNPLYFTVHNIPSPESSVNNDSLNINVDNFFDYSVDSGQRLTMPLYNGGKSKIEITSYNFGVTLCDFIIIFSEDSDFIENSLGNINLQETTFYSYCSTFGSVTIMPEDANYNNNLFSWIKPVELHVFMDASCYRATGSTAIKVSLGPTGVEIGRKVLFQDSIVLPTAAVATNYTPYLDKIIVFPRDILIPYMSMDTLEYSGVLSGGVVGCELRGNLIW